ncbi:MAG: XRE family transcriptional regulator [Myxococcales bacterium]|nr:XRE family transcriptional regulator [Myxococcales bacterium]
MTLTEGAEKLGVSRSYFSQLLAGRRALSPKVRRRLLANAPFSELGAEDLWRAPPEDPEEEVAHVA